jgi:hypothetical protein
MVNKNSAVSPNKSIAPTLKSQLPLMFQKQVRVAVGRDGAKQIELRRAVAG